MMTRVAAVCMAFAMLGSTPAPAVRASAIYATHLLDVRTGRTIDDAVVIASGGRVAYAGARSAARVPPDAERVDLGALTLLPGLIDAHVHLTLGGTPEANARATVEAGFTTVQDLGAVDETIFRLRDDIDAGRVAGPRILAAGRWIGRTNGTCDFSGIGVRGADAFRQRVREEIRRGADVIKVCVSGWLADARREPDRYEISNEELEAAITEAHRGRRPAAVHALSTAGVAAAVRLGADLVVHSAFVDRQTIDRMRARRVHLVPTLFSFARAQPEADVQAVESVVRGAVAAGLPIAFGTDAGVIAHGRNAREFEALARIGVTPIDAVRAATVHAARALRLDGTIGVLQKGASADVIAVDGNPLDDLTALQRVRYVMARGVTLRAPQ
jgi:imidazolonepropionase-like amidohydrolase